MEYLNCKSIVVNLYTSPRSVVLNYCINNLMFSYTKFNNIQSIFKKPIYQRKSPQILSHTRNQGLSIMIQGPSGKIFTNSQQRMKDTASATKKSITAVKFGEELDRGPHSKGMI